MQAKENPARDPKGGRPSKEESENYSNLIVSVSDSDTERENPNGSTKILRKLARDGHDDLLNAIAAEEISVNQAAIQVGYRKKPDPAESCLRAFKKVDNKLIVLKAILDEIEPDGCVVLPADPHSAAEAIRQQFGPDFTQRMIDALQTPQSQPRQTGTTPGPVLKRKRPTTSRRT